MPIEVELYTADHVIRGFLETAGDRLSDILNNKTESAILVGPAQVSRLLNLSKSPPTRLPLVRVEKKNLLFALPVQHDLTHKSLYRRATRMMFQILVFVPNFELRGAIHLTERLDIRRVLVVRPEDFVPLTDATATYVLYPQVTVKADTLVFNKAQVVFAGEERSELAPSP